MRVGLCNQVSLACNCLSLSYNQIILPFSESTPMTDNWTNRWNERYSSEAYAYGTAPNQYLQTQLEKLPAGKILFPAEGEGRNAVFAAKRGWQVAAFDISEAGKKKADQLAADNHVTVDYRVGTVAELGYTENEFDVIALVFAHFPPEIRSSLHQTLLSYLCKGGRLIFEAFSKKNLTYVQQNEKIGGPKDLASLFSIGEIRQEFPGLDFLELEETEIELHEGLYHNGRGMVIRFTAIKR